jgi:hypothetical protein
VTAAPALRKSSPGASWSSRCAGWRRTGLKAWSEVIARGYEGLVAKDEASADEAGPTRRWLKVKQKHWTVEEDGWRRSTAQAQVGRSAARS